MIRPLKWLRDRHRQAVDNHEHGALGWCMILNIAWLVFQIVRLMRGGNDNHNDSLKGDE